MKARHIALAAALMLAAPAAASAAAPIAEDTAIANRLVGVPLGQRSSSLFSILTDGMYDFTLLVGPNTGSSPSGSLTVRLVKLIGQTIDTITLPVTNGSQSSFTDSLNLLAGTYRFAWSGSVSGAGPLSTIKGTASITAVPGPEAGAGIGALAMGGLAFWMKRRRKDQALAA